MDVIDQRHALNTAHTAEQIAHDAPNADKILLIRTALLHDVGRQKGDMGLWGKVFAVLCAKFCPTKSKAIADEFLATTKLTAPRAAKKNNRLFLAWRRVLYVYFYHPDIGAEKLRAVGLGNEAMVVERHHLPPQANDSPELTLLRRADELN